jgi:hypothetical protein
MATENNKLAELRLVRQRHQCPVCGGPTSLREETIIRLGHPNEVRYAHRCSDPWCGGSLQRPETAREERG